MVKTRTVKYIQIEHGFSCDRCWVYFARLGKPYSNGQQVWLYRNVSSASLARLNRAVEGRLCAKGSWLFSSHYISARLEVLE